MNEAAQALATILAQRNAKIVFAESCTAGLVSATLAAIPGISNYLCGSAVTYREATKAAWLGVSEKQMALETAVCAEVALQMASGVLAKTAEADLAVSITGHLGPGAPEALDGCLYIGVALSERLVGSSVEEGPEQPPRARNQVSRHVLAPMDRIARQQAAARQVLQVAREVLLAIEGKRNCFPGSDEFGQV
ncbi:Nicotinamide-nucleotide amidohydrolase PncC [Roseimaritima multifibrata]|uniref:Nicotinamide-nucleotide amidohydrolase PncC n=1 Tax=Roseimaritima multifibrata TaxID=1930274 RepID=A0A517MKJ7_9BACT|nr:CinA family protein [Roseimaritima multifibrata]QDS95394.1 Nicotinamide-nucleotide amidohydrolase PncC [Roseimaritima multifibrata]